MNLAIEDNHQKSLTHYTVPETNIGTIFSDSIFQRAIRESNGIMGAIQTLVNLENTAVSNAIQGLA